MIYYLDNTLPINSTYSKSCNISKYLITQSSAVNQTSPGSQASISYLHRPPDPCSKDQGPICQPDIQQQPGACLQPPEQIPPRRSLRVGPLRLGTAAKIFQASCPVNRETKGRMKRSERTATLLRRQVTSEWQLEARQWICFLWGSSRS